MNNTKNNDGSAASAQRDIWKMFLDLILKKGIPKKNSIWYVNWVRQFSRFVKNRQFDKCSLRDVVLFLDHRREKPGGFLREAF